MILKKSLYEVVAIYEIPPINTPDDSVMGPLMFVLQIIKLAPKSFAVRLFRKEKVNIASALPKKNKKSMRLVTVEIYVLDDLLSDIHEKTGTKALNKAIEDLNNNFWTNSTSLFSSSASS